MDRIEMSSSVFNKEKRTDGSMIYPEDLRGKKYERQVGIPTVFMKEENGSEAHNDGELSHVEHDERESFFVEEDGELSHVEHDEREEFFLEEATTNTVYFEDEDEDEYIEPRPMYHTSAVESITGAISHQLLIRNTRNKHFLRDQHNKSYHNRDMEYEHWESIGRQPHLIVGNMPNHARGSSQPFQNLSSHASSSSQRHQDLVSQQSTTVELAIDESDDEIDSDDSYVPEEGDLYSSEHDTDSEIDVEELSDEDLDWSDIEHTLQSSSATEHPINTRAQHQPDSENVQNSRNDGTDFFYGKKNCFKWSSYSVRGSSTEAAHNTRVQPPKLQGPALNLGTSPSPEAVWKLFFTDEMVDNIVHHTNMKFEDRRRRGIYPKSPTYKNTDRDEINALLGLLLLCSIFKSNKESLRSLFSPSVTGRPIFRAINTQLRCFVLIKTLRFDDPSSRKEREKSDPGAAVSAIFQQFIMNSQKVYTMGAHGCVDESLVPFKGRCKFLVYMPKKTAKYGIKVLCLTDASNAYLFNAYIYCGKGIDDSTLTPAEKKMSFPTQSVIRLTKCLYHTNRNITVDNWFMSCEVAEELLKNGLTVVGTLKKSKPQIPPEFLPNQRRPVGSSLYGFTKDFTLLSFVPKPSKAHILLSSMHYKSSFDARNETPEIISFYNSTKCGVDNLDIKCSNYSVKRKTTRWPLAVFYHMLAMCSSNAFTLFNLFPGTEINQMSRFDFINSLGISLAKPFMESRLKIPNLPENVKDIIKKSLGMDKVEKPTTSAIKTDRLDRQDSCRYCPYQRKRGTIYKCIQCSTPTCLKCSKKICGLCLSQQK